MALENIRILDFSRIWAGPHATKLLADMGAEVIKVESTRAWDPHRTIVGSGNLPGGELGSDPWNRSGWFNTLHMSKLGITAELSHPGGKTLIEELVSISDVVVENFRAGAMARPDWATRTSDGCARTSWSRRCQRSATAAPGVISSSTASARSS